MIYPYTCACTSQRCQTFPIRNHYHLALSIYYQRTLRKVSLVIDDQSEQYCSVIQNTSCQYNGLNIVPKAAWQLYFSIHSWNHFYYYKNRIVVICFSSPQCDCKALSVSSCWYIIDSLMILFHIWKSRYVELCTKQNSRT